MKATTKGAIGAIIGSVLMLIGSIVTLMQGDESGLVMLAAAIPLGGLYGFGYAFGFSQIKKWLSRTLGVAATGSLITILFSRNKAHGFMITWVLSLMVLALGMVIAVLPGVFNGIKAIRAERRSAAYI